MDLKCKKECGHLFDYYRWITNSYEADTFLVFANVDPSKGYKGITCFIVERGMGVQIAKKEKKVFSYIGVGTDLFLAWNPLFLHLCCYT